MFKARVAVACLFRLLNASVFVYLSLEIPIVLVLRLF